LLQTISEPFLKICCVPQKKEHHTGLEQHEGVNYRIYIYISQHIKGYAKKIFCIIKHSDQTPTIIKYSVSLPPLALNISEITAIS